MLPGVLIALTVRKATLTLIHSAVLPYCRAAVQGTKEYALQPGEHDALLEAQWGLTRGTLRKMNRGLTVGALPYSCRLKVPWHVRA